MPEAISLENFNYYLNYFNRLKKAGLKFNIQKTESWETSAGGASYSRLKFYATFQQVRGMQGLAEIWTAAPMPVDLHSIEMFPALAEICKHSNVVEISGDALRKNYEGVKFYSKSVFDEMPRVQIYFISEPPHEHTHEGHTIRTCLHGTAYSSGELVFCADESSAYFNYVDKGHVIVYVSTGDHAIDGSRMFITDALTLDMNYIIAAASCHPQVVDAFIQHNAFLPSKDSRMTLLKIEKSLPPKAREAYGQLKQRIQEDFVKNTSSVMIGKLARKESPFIDLNGIRITSTRADYTAGHVSIEAPNLADVVFAKLNPNEAEWDIFTLINIYTDWVNEQFKKMPLNDECTGFQTGREFSFKINDIPLKVACSVENTRRSINGMLINVDELSPVLKRAACYQVPEDKTEEDNVKNFNKFIANVSRYSLKIRDVWANGLPVKTVLLESDKLWGRPATPKHPKLRFVLKDKKGFYLQVKVMDEKDKTKVSKTNEYRVGKFAEFVKKVETVNKETNMGYQGNFVRTPEGFYVPRPEYPTINSCASRLSSLLGAYADGITEDDKKSIVGVINYECSESEKRSEALLKEACELTKSVPGTRNGQKGYVVTGKLRTYFVEEEGSMKVWDNNPASTNPYVCIVNRGEMGIGKDALVARLFALYNDEMMTKQIHTLKR